MEERQFWTEVGKRIKERRCILNITQSALSKHLNITRTAIGKIVRGEVGVSSLELT